MNESLSDAAVRGVTTNTTAVVPEAVRPPLTFAERYARDTPYPDVVREHVRQMRERWLWEQSHPRGSASNPLTLVVPQWVEDIAIAEGTTAQDRATNMFRPYVVEVTVLEPYK